MSYYFKGEKENNLGGHSGEVLKDFHSPIIFTQKKKKNPII